jgi:hypothetical protein
MNEDSPPPSASGVGRASPDVGTVTQGSLAAVMTAAKPSFLESVWAKASASYAALKQSKAYLSVSKMVPKIPYLNSGETGSVKVKTNSNSANYAVSSSTLSSGLNTTTVWLIVTVHSIISMVVDSSTTLKVTTVFVGLLWIFGQHTIYEIEDLRQMSSWAVRNTAKSYIDNALNGSILNALWLVIVTLYMPIIYGFQHDRLFSESSVLLFALICGAQYLLWNLFRVYLINRHSIITDIQRYGCWRKLENFKSSVYSSMVPPVVPQNWKIGCRYSQGDIIVVSSGGAKGLAAADSGPEVKTYYELQSASSCIVETQLLTVTPSYGGTEAAASDPSTAANACFPLSSLLWCYCNPLLALLMTAPDVGEPPAGETQMYTCNAMFRCFAWDRGEVFASTVLKLLLFGILAVSMIQCAVGLFQSKGTQFVVAGMVNTCLVLYTLVVMMIAQVQRQRKLHEKTIRADSSSIGTSQGSERDASTGGKAGKRE